MNTPPRTDRRDPLPGWGPPQPPDLAESTPPAPSPPPPAQDDFWSALPPPPPRPPSWGPAPGWAPPGWTPPGRRSQDPQPPTRPSPGVSVQNLLLGLGAALITAAALVFTAVNWSRLGATFQGLALLVVTSVAASGAALTARRRMPATAEALGLVAVVLAIADAHAIRLAFVTMEEPWGYWAGALAVTSIGAWLFGVGTDIRSTRVVAAGLGQLPLVAGLVALHAFDSSGSAQLAAIALLAQAAAVSVLVCRWSSPPPQAQVVAAVVATGTWAVTVAPAVAVVAWNAQDWFGSSDNRFGDVAVLAAGAAVPAVVAWLRADRDGDRNLALGATTALALFDVWVTAGLLLPARWTDEGAALVAVGVVAVGLRISRRWGRTPALVGAGAAGLVVIQLVGVLANAVAAPFEVAGQAWQVHASALARTFSAGAGDVAGPGPLALQLLLLGLLVAAATPMLKARTVAIAAGAVAMLGVLVAPFLLPLSVAGAAAVAIGGSAVAAAIGSVVAYRQPLAVRTGPYLASASGFGAETAASPGAFSAPTDPGAPWTSQTIDPLPSAQPADDLVVPVVMATLLALVGLAWAAGSVATTLGGLGVVSVIALALLVVARDLDVVVVARPAAVAAMVAVVAGVGLAVGANGVSPALAWAVAGATALVLGLAAGLLVDPEGQGVGSDARLSVVVEAAAWSLHGIALWTILTIGEPRVALTASLGAGVLGAALQAARAGRRPFAGVAVGHALVLIWLQLVDAGIRAPEPYVLPLAATLLGAGLVAERRQRNRLDDGPPLASWVWLGPALVVGFTPTVLVSLSQPGLVRPLVALAAGAVLLAIGALTAQRAAVDVGAGVVVLLGLGQLGPVVGGLPNWATLATSGTLLLVIGATFEQRRRDLVDVRHRYRSLR